jgi:hypothetical protein
MVPCMYQGLWDHTPHALNLATTLIYDPLFLRHRVAFWQNRASFFLCDVNVMLVDVHSIKDDVLFLLY